MRSRKEVHIDYGSPERVKQICEKHIKNRPTTSTEAYTTPEGAGVGIDPHDPNYQWRWKKSVEISNRTEGLPPLLDEKPEDEKWREKVLSEDNELSEYRKPLPEYQVVDVGEMMDILEKWLACLKIEEEKIRLAQWTEDCEEEANRRLKEKVEVEYKGMVIFTVDVGQLPHKEAMEFLTDQEEKMKPILDRLPHDLAKLFHTCRGSGDKVEYIKF